MDLNFWLSTLSLAILGYVVYTWYLERRAERQPAERVKNKSRLPAFRGRSPGSSVQNAVNAGSGHQEAKHERVHVQPNVPRSAEIAPAGATGAAPEPAGDGFTLTTRELMHLTEAINQRREGATVEEAICGAFQVTKGGSEGYRRAKAIWDAATAAPGAAPAGTYAAAAPIKRRRRVVAH